MPHTLPFCRPLGALVTFTVCLSMVLIIAERADAAPPVDELVWTNESCISGLGSATFTAHGNGRWATVEVEVSTDGGGSFFSPGTIYQVWRLEHGLAMGVGYPQADQFRARDIKNNGTAIGDWVYSTSIDC